MMLRAQLEQLKFKCLNRTPFPPQVLHVVEFCKQFFKPISMHTYINTVCVVVCVGMYTYSVCVCEGFCS